MEPKDPEATWRDYYQRKKAQRLEEAAILWRQICRRRKRGRRVSDVAAGQPTDYCPPVPHLSAPSPTESAGLLDVHIVQKQHLEMDIQLQRTAKALDQGDRAGVHCSA